MAENKAGGLAVVAALVVLVLVTQLSSKIEGASANSENAEQTAYELTSRIESVEASVSDMERRSTYRW